MSLRHGRPEPDDTGHFLFRQVIQLLDFPFGLLGRVDDEHLITAFGHSFIDAHHRPRSCIGIEPRYDDTDHFRLFRFQALRELVRLIVRLLNDPLNLFASCLSDRTPVQETGDGTFCDSGQLGDVIDCHLFHLKNLHTKKLTRQTPSVQWLITYRFLKFK